MLGRELLDRAVDDLEPAQLLMVYSHHERVDGKGYPVGLVGEDLDGLAGDGDFGTSLATGFRQIEKEWDDIPKTDIGAMLLMPALARWLFRDRLAPSTHDHPHG
mgnify:CR=1 FL=1